MLKRGYLNAEEKNFYMVARAFIQAIDGKRTVNNKEQEEVWKEWTKRGMMTPSMQKNIKLVRTYLSKFCEEIEESLDHKEKSKLEKQLMKFDYRLVDEYTMQKLFRDINDHMKYAVIERDKLMEVMETIAAIKCVGCTKDYKECPISKMLDDISVPYLGEETNCPYACNLEKLNDVEKKNVEKIKKELRSRNQITREVI